MLFLISIDFLKPKLNFFYPFFQCVLTEYACYGRSMSIVPIYDTLGPKAFTLIVNEGECNFKTHLNHLFLAIHIQFILHCLNLS